MTAISVVLVDDHPVVRNGIRGLLEKADDILVVGEGENGEDALRLVVQHRPDVLLLDMDMKIMAGTEVAKRLRAENHPVRILALSAYNQKHYIQALLDSGAAGYLIKDEAISNIIEAIRGIAAGETGWFSRAVARQMAQWVREDPGLSEREREVLVLIAKGLDNRQIAQQLQISEGTVKNHVSSIYTKLDVNSRSAAAAWAWQQKLLGDEGA